MVSLNDLKFNMDDLLGSLDKKMQASVEYYRSELSQIRTGKATPALVDNIIVEAYGGTAKLKIMELATISTEGPTTLIITPYDNATLPEIQKAITASPLGLSSSVQGPLIRVSIPPLSEEQRRSYVKLVGQKVEAAKEQLRVSRDDARRLVKANFEAKTLTEDDRHNMEKNIDESVKKYTDGLETMKQKKQEEIMNL